MRLKYFVTGANGFIGKNLVRNLLDTENEVVTLSREGDGIKGAVNMQGDILNLNDVRRAMDDCQIVIHLAAVTPYSLILANPLEAYEIYIRGTINVLNACYKNSCHTFLFASSGKVYGNYENISVSEDSPVKPQTFMGKLKAEVESLLKLYSSEIDGKCRIAALRMFNIYGPGQSSHFLIPKLIHSLGKGGTIIQIGDMQVKRDYIYISDVISAINIINKNVPVGFSAYNIGSGKSRSIQDIISLIEKISNSTVKLSIDPKKMRSKEGKMEQADIKKMLALGWNPRISLEEGLNETLKYYICE